MGWNTMSGGRDAVYASVPGAWCEPDDAHVCAQCRDTVFQVANDDTEES